MRAALALFGMGGSVPVGWAELQGARPHAPAAYEYALRGFEQVSTAELLPGAVVLRQALNIAPNPNPNPNPTPNPNPNANPNPNQGAARGATRHPLSRVLLPRARRPRRTDRRRARAARRQG